jgi:hypothetical protein
MLKIRLCNSANYLKRDERNMLIGKIKDQKYAPEKQAF